MKFLIDECLSPELARIAQARGHGESSHIEDMRAQITLELADEGRSPGGARETGAAGVD